MKTNSQLRQEGRAALTGNYGMAVLATFLYAIIASVLSSFNSLPQARYLLDPTYLFDNMGANSTYSLISTLLNIFILLPISYGFILMFLKLGRNRDIDIISEMFKGFSSYWRAVGVQFLVALYTFLWSLLLIIPGIIKGFAYSMTVFISYEHPEYSVDDCIEQSQKMMMGHKSQLFCMSLGFFGLSLLSVIALCIPMLWIIPWWQMTLAKFYEDLKELPENADRPLSA